MKLSILIPCKNEEATIASVIQNCRKYFPDTEVYVGDNCCTDRTKEIAEKCQASVIPCPIPGKGGALKVLTDRVQSDYFIWIDGDGTYDMKDALTLWKTMQTGPYVMAIGDRRLSYFAENKSLLHGFGNRLVPWILKRKFKTSKSLDVLSGLRIVKRSFLKSYPIQSNGFTVEIEVTMNLLRSKLPYLQQNISYHDRAGGQTKIHALKDGKEILAWIRTH